MGSGKEKTPEKEVDRKLEAVKDAKAVSRHSKHGKAGFHSTKKGDKGYSRHPKHKGKKSEDNL